VKASDIHLGFPVPSSLWEDPAKRINRMLNYYSDKEEDDKNMNEKSKILKAMHNYCKMSSIIDEDLSSALEYLNKIKNLINDATGEVSWLDRVSRNANDSIITQYTAKIGVCMSESGNYNVFAVNSTYKYIGGIDADFISVELTKQELAFMLAWLEEQLAEE
jgi:hypothetical protein